MSVRITHITFQHYKAFEQFSISLEHVNLLTGRNNAGKSTVIGALRALAIAHRSAKTRSPERLRVGDRSIHGYRISQKVLPISTENVLTDYLEGDSQVVFDLSNGNKLTLLFDSEWGCILVPTTTKTAVSTAAAFKVQFPIDLKVVPVLGAIEHKETLLEEGTVNASLATSRASRHFRNYWYRNREEFGQFSDLVGSTWPGMRLKRPELDLMSRELTMFVSEDRIDRELFWVGFGFQIWCQLLTHIARATPDSLIVIDEPEIYLHPDIQLHLLQVLRGTGADVLVATHSAAILSGAASGEVVLIDKRQTDAKRVTQAIPESIALCT